MEIPGFLQGGSTSTPAMPAFTCLLYTSYIVLIEQPEQIAEIHTPNTSGYCTVSSGGDVQYYQIE